MIGAAFAIVAALTIQSGRQSPTVGDTVWVRRAVALPPRFTARAADWELEGDVELLGRPQLLIRGDSAIVRYPVVAWTPGTHTVTVPGPTLLAPDGAIDSAAPVPVTFTVRSVLPDRPASTLRPLPPAGLVCRRPVSLLPLGVLLLVAAALLLPVGWWWRRTGRATTLPDAPAVPPIPVERWADAGEARAVLALAASNVRGAIAAGEPDAHEGLDVETCLAVLRERRPAWPLADLTQLLRELDAARFAPGSPADALRLYREADAVAHRLAEAA